MPRTLARWGILTIAGAVLTAAPASGGAETTNVSAGRLVAQRNCASCHAIADGKSPLPDAPPFTHLRYRYGAGGLTELLKEGMIKDWPSPLEEGTRQLHMPAFPLSVDEIAALTEYLRSLKPGDDGGASAKHK
jgi:mono/diheme cytochrome c family protein